MIKKRKQTLLITILVAPAVILFTYLVVFPVFQAAFFSFFKWNGLGPLSQDKFRGLDNFVNLFQDPVFINAIRNNIIVVALSLVIEIPLALYVAFLINNKKFKGAVFFRTFFFLPYVLSEVITGLLWQFIYNPQYGFIKALYTAFAPESPVPAFLADPKTVLGAIMVALVWKYFGFHMSILIAGLQDIPEDVREAAKVDGASEMQTTWKIVIPMLKPTLFISVFFSIVGSLQVFDVVWAMSRGGPVNASETMVTYLYTYGMKRMNIGYGSAVAIVIFTFCLVFSIFYNKFTFDKEEK
jgi:raffinose/stachyose/melibiose transport system permease protein